ncbi:protein of unknown function [Rhodovastum atsumiense]|nr:protein of unknown function [Rhodovastum atsumiense]
MGRWPSSANSNWTWFPLATVAMKAMAVIMEVTMVATIMAVTMAAIGLGGDGGAGIITNPF